MDTGAIEKVCPFCEEIFSAKEIKSHIGVNHLGIPLSETESIANDTSANEVVESPSIKKELPEELNIKQSEPKEKSKKSFPCNHCNKRFDAKQRWKNHIEMFHSDNKRFACEQCPKIFNLGFKLKEHINIVHLGKFPTCSICDKKFKSNSTLRSHSKIVHKIKALALQCSKCERLFWNKVGLRNHEKKCRPNQSNNLESVGPEKNLESNQPRDQNEVTDDVEMKLREEAEKNEIPRKKNEPNSKTISPRKNPKSRSGGQPKSRFGGKKKKSRSGGKRYQCAQCDQSYAFHSDFKRHIRVKHEGSITFRCDLCDMNFTKNSSLKAHHDTKMHLKMKHGNVQATNVLQKASLTPYNEETYPVVVLQRISTKLIESFQQIDDESTKVQSMKCEESFQPLKSNKMAKDMKQPTIRLERLSKHTIKMYQQSDEKIAKQNSDVENEEENTYNFSLVLNVTEDSSKDLEEPVAASIEEDFNLQKLQEHSFLCMHCNKRFKTRNHLTQHDQTVHQKVRYNADQCSKSYRRQQRQLGKHRNVDHLKPYFECDQCEKKFKFKGKLDDHVRMVHTKAIPQLLETSSCNQESPSNEDSNKDVPKDGEKQMNRYFCDSCPKSFCGSQWLKLHIDSAHRGIRYECSHCSKKFKNKKYVRKHIRTKHSDSSNTKAIPRLVDTSSCVQESPSNVDSSKISYGQKQKNRYFCDSCPKTFCDMRWLERHIDSTHRGIRFECSQCSKKFKDRIWFRHHVKTKHSDSRKTKEHTNHSNDGTNLETSSIQGELLCDSCGNVFENKESLDNHKKVDHGNTKENQAGNLQELCESCGQMFETVEALDNHVKVNHSGNNVSHASNETPAIHQTERIKETEGTKDKRKFPCDSCRRIFNSRPGLKHHKQVVHERLRFSCADCSKTFTSKQYFSNHPCDATNKV